MSSVSESEKIAPPKRAGEAPKENQAKRARVESGSEDSGKQKRQDNVSAPASVSTSGGEAKENGQRLQVTNDETKSLEQRPLQQLAKETSGKCDSLASSSSPFAQFSATTTGSGFGSTGGFGFGSIASSGNSIASPFGALASSSETKSTSNGFGFGTSSTDHDSAFLPKAAPPSIFSATGSTNQQESGDEHEDGDADDVAADSDSTSDVGPGVSNGEEGERVVMQVRAKLFQLNGNQWIERGIGPLRLLEPDNSLSEGKTIPTVPRIVMRRENHPGGHGTKLLLNLALAKHVTSAHQGDRAIRITCVELSNSEPTIVTYLFRLEKGANADALAKHIEARIPSGDQSS